MNFDSLWAKYDTSMFCQILAQSNLNLHIPDSYIVEPIHKNYDVFYQYAVKHTEKKHEIRYLVRNLSNVGTDSNSVTADKFSFSIFSLLSMNAAGNNFSNMPVINIIEKKDYPGNLPVVWAAYSDFNPSTDFGKEYLFCRIYGFRLKNNVMLYYFLMFENYYRDNYLEKAIIESVNYSE